MHRETLPLATQRALAEIAKISLPRQFYLAGGTGLALHFGHRLSADLDFFTPDRFDINALTAAFARTGSFQLEQKAEQTVIGVFLRTKVAFFHYPYPLLVPAIEVDDMSLASVIDIACMKLDAVAARGTKRDFIDVYVVAHEHTPLSDLLRQFQRKYASLRYNMAHLQKSLVFFDEADNDPMPVMLRMLQWEDVKAFFRREVLLLTS